MIYLLTFLRILLNFLYFDSSVLTRVSSTYGNRVKWTTIDATLEPLLLHWRDFRQSGEAFGRLEGQMLARPTSMSLCLSVCIPCLSVCLSIYRAGSIFRKQFGVFNSHKWHDKECIWWSKWGYLDKPVLYLKHGTSVFDTKVSVFD